MDNNNNPNAQAAIFSPATDFIETPVDNAATDEPVLGEKSINIIDETPEAEGLIAGEPQPEPAAEPAPASAPAPTDSEKAPDTHFDPDHAFDPGNEVLFNALREKLTVLRRERDELIAQIDKKEDEFTDFERTKAQYEVSGDYDAIDYNRSDILNEEIRKLDSKCRVKERSIRSILGLLHTL